MEKVKDIGEINYYSEEKVKAIELEIFGIRGIKGYLDAPHETPKIQWPF
jgi:hypothetical protein